MRIDHNWFYANNLDVYRASSPFEALVPQPVGTGFWWAGNNDGDFVKNWVFDNYRQGTFLISIPDAVSGEIEGAIDSQVHCPNTPGPFGLASTSCYNSYVGNHMGQVPPNFEPHPGLRKFGNKTTLTQRSRRARNGLDFVWDEQPVNLGNCWANNTGPDGTRRSIRSDPPIAPTAGQNTPGFLPEHCTTPPANPSDPANHAPGTSMGDGPSYLEKAPTLLTCYGEWDTGNLEQSGCTWWNTPAAPGSGASRASQRAERRAGEQWAQSPAGANLREWVHDLSGADFFGPANG